MAGKRGREANESEDPKLSTPKKLRFGPPATDSARTTPIKSALKQRVTSNGTHNPSSAAATPSNRASKRAAILETPQRKGKGVGAATPSSAARRADRSARKKATRNLIERVAAGDSSDDELGDQLTHQIFDEEEEDEDSDEEAEVNDADALPSTEAGATTDGVVAGDAATPSKRGRGRPKGAKNKRTPTPPPDLPPPELYFFQNRPSAWKYTSNTPNNLKLLAHGEYYAAMEAYEDPHADSIAALHEHHAHSFPLWAFEMHQGFTVVLHGYGSKRRLLTGFCDYLHGHAPRGQPPTTVIVQAHHPAFTLRALLHAVAKAAGLETAALPATVPALLERIDTHLSTSPRSPNSPIYLLISTLTARALSTSSALSALTSLACNPSIALLLTASNPSFPLLWPSTVRDALNPVLHDATTFLPYDSGTGPATAAAAAPPLDPSMSIGALPIPAPPPGLSPLGGSAPDAVAELLGRKAILFATRERVRWVLRSLPLNARGLYQLLLEAILAAADADAAFEGGGGGGSGFGNDAFDAGDFNPFDADPDMNLDLGDLPHGAAPAAALPPLAKRGRGRPKKNGLFSGSAGSGGRGGGAASADAAGAALPAISSKTLYAAASSAFLCSSEMAFRGLLREFVDHAMVDVHRADGLGAVEGGDQLAVAMSRAEAEEVLADLKAEA